MAKRQFNSFPLYDALQSLGFDEENPLSDEKRKQASLELQSYIDHESLSVLKSFVRFLGYGSGVLRAELKQASDE